MAKAESKISGEDMEVSTEDNGILIGGHLDFLRGLSNMIDEVPALPAWIQKGGKKLRTLVASTENTKSHLRHLAFPSALNHLRETAAILKYRDVPRSREARTHTDLSTLCIAYENNTPIHPTPLLSGDKKILKKFLDQLSQGTGGMHY